MGAGLLAKVLFSVAGRGITVKHVLFGIGGIILAIAIYLGFRVVNNHFQHIRDLETKNGQLQRDLGSARAELRTATETNKNNQAVQKTNDDILHHNQDLAAQERAATKARTETYREIRDAIDQAPAPAPSRTEQPVAPVVRGTLDSLWGRGTTGPGNPSGSSGTHGLR